MSDEELKNLSEVVALKNGAGYYLKRHYVFLMWCVGIMSFLMSASAVYGIFVSPALWKAKVENEMKDLHRADTNTINMVRNVADGINTLIDNQNIIMNNQQVFFDNQVEIRTNVVDLRNKLHTGWITPIPDNYQRMQRLKQNKIK
jgi:hypothetical protein